MRYDFCRVERAVRWIRKINGGLALLAPDFLGGEKGICLMHRRARQCALLCDASAWSTAAGRMGRWRKRAPVAAKMAFPMAGATTVVPGSPRPTGASTLAMDSKSSAGTSPIRSGVYLVEFRAFPLPF